MKRLLKLLARVVMMVGVAACSANGSWPGVPRAPGQSLLGAQSARNVRELWGPNVAAVCADALPGDAQCAALLRTDIAPSMHPVTIEGLTPADFQSAYDLPSSKKGGASDRGYRRCL